MKVKDLITIMAKKEDIDDPLRYEWFLFNVLVQKKICLANLQFFSESLPRSFRKK